jgi:hypothetical protein
MPRGAGALELPDRSRDVESAAEARVGVDEQRQRGRPGDAARVLDDVVERRHAEIGQTEGCVRDAGSR